MDIKETIQECADYALKYCNDYLEGKIAAQLKPDRSWVTEADNHIESVWRKKIQHNHPSHYIYGEEQGGQLSPTGVTWILDPIDGTFSFVHGLPFYSSLCAVLIDGVPTFGCALLPGMNVVMFAEKNKGLTINNHKYVRPSLVGSPTIEIVATADAYRFRIENKESTLKELYLNDVKSRTYPDGLGYYLLLNGHVRAFVDPKVEIWDIAPFHVILPEAGFHIGPWEGGTELKRGTSIAYAIDKKKNPVMCDDVLSLLR